MKTLETKRLILRKYTSDDFTPVHDYGSCAENTTYMLWGPNTEEQTWSYLESAIEEANKSPIDNYHYAVVLKESGTLIGGCGIHLSDDEAEIGWILHRNYWHQGYATEMGLELLRFSFEDLNLRRLLAHCDADNTASYRLMEKLGMRREGLFFDARPPHKQSQRKYSDELAYAILRDEWNAKKEITYYNNLSFVFDDFIELPELTDGDIHLVCTTKMAADPVKKWVPAYDFAVCKGSEKIGMINLRIGYTEGLYYGGQIGYGINEKYRGNGYAVTACRLLLPVAKAHNMEKLLITNNVTNHASKRVCEKLGARLVRIARTPEWHDLYKEGHRFSNIFEWSVDDGNCEI